MRTDKKAILIFAIITILISSCELIGGLFNDAETSKSTIIRIIKNSSGHHVDISVFASGGILIDTLNIQDGDSIINEAQCIFSTVVGATQSTECVELEFTGIEDLDSVVVYFDHQRKQRFCNSFEDSCSLGLGDRYAMHFLTLNRGYVVTDAGTRRITYTYTFSEEDYLSAVDILQ